MGCTKWSFVRWHSTFARPHHTYIPPGMFHLTIHSVVIPPCILSRPYHASFILPPHCRSIVQWLVEEEGCDPDTLAADGTAPIGLAAWQGRMEIFRYLVAHGANVHAINSYGCNVAMWAAQGVATTVETFDLLKTLGVNMDVRCSFLGKGFFVNRCPWILLCRAALPVCY